MNDTKNPHIRTDTSPERQKHLEYLAQSGDPVARDALACGRAQAEHAIADAGGVVLTAEEWQAIKGLLRYSWEDVDGDYCYLTEKERKIISWEMFEKISVKIGLHAPKKEDRRG